MKHIFLDIDGVLTSTRSVFAKIGSEYASRSQRANQADLIQTKGRDPTILHLLNTIDPVCVSLVKTLFQESGAKLVLSSAHRTRFIDPDDYSRPRSSRMYGNAAHLYDLRTLMWSIGLQIETDETGRPLVDVTQQPSGKSRKEEVQEYVERFEVDTYVILDDENVFGTDAPLVWCDLRYGFSFDNYQKAKLLLGS